VTEEGQVVLGWREVPIDDRLLGASAVAAEPMFKQLFIGAGPEFAKEGPDRQARFDRW
jgi:glutamate synthase (NADPH) large chain